MANAPQPASVRPNLSQSGSTGTRSNFGASAVEGNRIGLIDGSFFQTQDGTAGTNLVSPLSVTTGTVIPLVFPANAVSVTLLAMTNGVQVSEQPGTTGFTQYFVLPAGIPQTIPASRLTALYVLGVTGTSVLSFFFTTI